MANITSRLDEFRLKKSLSYGALEKLVGCSEGTLYKAITNKTGFNANILATLTEKFPDLSCEWLLRGRGCMFYLPDDIRLVNVPSDTPDDVIEDNLPTQKEYELMGRVNMLERLCDEKDQHLQDLRTLCGLTKKEDLGTEQDLPKVSSI